MEHNTKSRSTFHSVASILLYGTVSVATTILTKGVISSWSFNYLTILMFLERIAMLVAANAAGAAPAGLLHSARQLWPVTFAAVPTPPYLVAQFPDIGQCRRWSAAGCALSPLGPQGN
jgi:hypothetical protein